MVTSLVMKSLSLWMSCSTILIPIAKTVLCYTLIWYVLLWGFILLRSLEGLVLGNLAQ